MKKVRLLVRKGQNDANSVVEYDDGTADWLVAKGFAFAMQETPKREQPKQEQAAEDNRKSSTPLATPRRGRPPKNVS